MPQRSGDDRSQTQTREPREQPREETTGGGRADAEAGRDGTSETTRWFANTAVQAGLTVIGVVLLIFAIGQAVGLPLLDFTVEALSSQTGRWLVVAFFAILLIGAAQRVGSTT